MVLTLGLSGIPFAGADVGGFFGEPSAELLSRWYQAAAYLPFYRGHAHLDAPRREPFLLPPAHAAAATEAVRERQRLLPYWNTLWWAATEGGGEEAGLPLAAPPWLRLGLLTDEAEPPASSASSASSGSSGSSAADEAARGLLRAEGQWLLGTALLVQPVTEEGVLSVAVSLPAGGSAAPGAAPGAGADGAGADGAGAGGVAAMAPAPLLWYDTSTGGAAHLGGSSVRVLTPLAVTPRFQLGGSIVPRRERVRRSALLAMADPISLHVAADAAGAATGRLFLEDGVSTPERSGRPAALIDFSFACDATSPPRVANVTACELRAAPSSRWAGASSAAPLAQRVHVESLLVRGPFAADGVSAALLVQPTGGEAAVEVAIEASTSAHGLHLSRFAAPLEASWTIAIRSRAQLIWPDGLVRVTT